MVYEDDRLTFEEHFRQAATFARRLSERYGVSKGDRVAIAMRNFPEWSVAFCGAAALGAVVVPLNAWWTAPELEYGLRDSGAKVLVADAERASPARRRAARRWTSPPIVVRGEGTPPAGRRDVDGRARSPSTDDAAGRRGRPRGRRDDLLHVGHDRPPQGRARHPAQHHDEPAEPRVRDDGRRRTRRRDAGGGRRAAAPRHLLCVPLFHATGCHSVLITAALTGGMIVLMHKWDTERALELIERERVTMFGGVPTMAWQVLQSPRLRRLRHLQPDQRLVRRRARAARRSSTRSRSCSRTARPATATA